MSAAGADAQASTRIPARFSVATSIGVEQIVPFSGENLVNAAVVALPSPDSSHFLIHTRRGDLARNANIERLLVYDRAGLQHYLDTAKGLPPASKTIASLAVMRNDGGFADIRWIDADHIGYLGPDAHGVTQGFSVDISSGASEELTHSETDVATFDVSHNNVLYYAHIASLSAAPDIQVIDTQLLGDLLFPATGGDDTPLILMRRSRATGRATQIGGPAQIATPRLWMSPDGKHAITVWPATNAPSSWQTYEVISDEFRWTAAKVRADATSWDLLQRRRLYLINLENNDLRPLLDAPDGTLSKSQGPMDIYWSSNQSVVASHIFLPLIGAKDEMHRRAGAAIAEIDIATGADRPILWEPLQGVGGVPADIITALQWKASVSELTVTLRATGGKLREQRFVRSGNGWMEAAAIASAQDRVEVKREEAMDSAPKLFVRGGPCNCAKLLFDPAPELAHLALGKLQRFGWSDRNGIQWTGGLLLPPDYKTDRRYPLVIQTHGFLTGQFLKDGPSEGVGTAFAAQALAAAGFVVLQVREGREAVTNDEREASLTAEGYRAGIEALIDKGMIDRSRVGLIAFSRTGLAAIRLIADNPDLLAAADIADAGWWGYVSYLLRTNAISDIAEQVARISGGTPSPTKPGQWIDNDPLYAAARSRTAIRIESASGLPAVLMNWELYSVLKAAKRPVEMIYFRSGTHNLQLPRQQLASADGNVDWFRFWLLGEEQPDSAKASQFARWRSMRAVSPPL
ncbi:MAG: putative prolyl oligopeptidase family protein [Bradyrhizobium sp.]|nr:putative prolyl oligopeptidase family protein [Bradyrhizobium sp.]